MTRLCQMLDDGCIGWVVKLTFFILLRKHVDVRLLFAAGLLLLRLAGASAG